MCNLIVHISTSLPFSKDSRTQYRPYEGVFMRGGKKPNMQAVVEHVSSRGHN